MFQPDVICGAVQCHIQGVQSACQCTGVDCVPSDCQWVTPVGNVNCVRSDCQFVTAVGDDSCVQSSCGCQYTTAVAGVNSVVEHTGCCKVTMSDCQCVTALGWCQLCCGQLTAVYQVYLIVSARLQWGGVNCLAAGTDCCTSTLSDCQCETPLGGVNCLPAGTDCCTSTLSDDQCVAAVAVLWPALIAVHALCLMVSALLQWVVSTMLWAAL